MGIFTKGHLKMSWEVHKKLERRLVRIWQKLKDTDMMAILENKFYESSFVTECGSFRWICSEGKIIFFDGKIVTIRKDPDMLFENTLLKTAPDDILKDICYFLNNL